MEYIFGLLLIGIIGGILIWRKTRRKKYVVVYLIILLLFLLLPWILLFLALASGEEFPG